MNFFNTLKDDIIKIIQELETEGSLPSGMVADRVSVEPPRDASHGDIATNAAMILCKQAGMKPREIAELLAVKMRLNPIVSKVEIAGPGFINIRLSDEFWCSRLRDVLVSGSSYGSSKIGNGKKINVEFISCNPTGPMHVGHGRGAVFGDVLASLLSKVGYDVTREFYVNDAGAQVDVLARSVYIRYLEALGEEVGQIPEGLYPGEYLLPVAKEIAAKDGAKWKGLPEKDWLGYFRQRAVDAMLDIIREDLALLGIKFDVFFSERAMIEAGEVEKVLEDLEKQGLIYEGVLEPPKGKKPENWEPRPQLLFRSTNFGDDVDRPLKKSDGSYTYFAPDIAYHLDKYRRGFSEMINVWGADHGGYVKRMHSAVKAVSDNKGELDVKLCQMVNLMDNGVPVKMSKRSGNFITVRSVVEKVGKDVMRFIMLTRKNDAQLDFDLTKVMEQSRENPVFYVQYAHARICSVLRKAEELFPDEDFSSSSLAKTKVECLTDSAELALIKIMAGWSREVEIAAKAHEPHRIAYCLHDLAAGFHSLWNKGKDNTSLRFLIEEEPELSMARVALLKSVAIVIASGLNIFGVEPVEEM